MGYRDPRQYRRLCTIDAVSLCTDSILKLLQNTHDAGIIHRDVKPSNVVRAGRKRNETSFRLVDFGLSKSFVVPSNSPLGESKWPWGKIWQGGGKGGDEGCFRAEREKAEFRGTSMYASLRVHQEKDYCRRDDIWGLLYVFCDLVSGGLPWMGYAAERKRDACKRMKEWVHGESSGEDNKGDHTEELLKDANYHLARHQRKAAREKEKRKKEPCPSDNPNNDSVLLDQVDDESEEDEEHWNLPPPLAMSHDVTKVNALRKAFRHVATLSFNDEPNYKLIESCLREFTIRTEITETDEIPPINWEEGVSIQSSSRKRDRDQNTVKSNNISSKEETNQDLFVKKGLVQFYPHDLHNKDPLLESELVDAERERARKDVIDGKDSNNSGGNNAGSRGGVSSDLSRLPLTLAYRLAQVEYNNANPDTVPPYLAFRDWFALAAELRCMYFTWDSKKYEIGTKRTNNDKYKRELYAKLLEYCVTVGEAYKGFNMKGMLDSQRLGVIWFNEDGNKHTYDEDIINGKFIENGIKNEDSDKSPCNNEFRDNNIMIVFALVKVALDIILVKEIAKEIAPPPELTFGVSSMKRET